MANGTWRGLATLCFAAALALIGAPAWANAVNCTASSSALVTALSAIDNGSFLTLTLTGTCVGNISPPSDITISGGTIEGTVTINGVNNVLLSGVTLDGSDSFNHSAVVVQNSGSVISLNNVTVQNWLSGINGAVSVLQGGTLIMNGGLITTSEVEGGGSFAAVFVGSNSFAALGGVEITGNFSGVTLVGSKATLTGVNIHANSGGNAISATQSDLQVIGGTVAGSTNDATPTIALIRSSMVAGTGAMIVGPNIANTIYATPGSIVKLTGATVTNNDATDATILVGDGSTLLSVGGNTISNSAGGGTAITVANGSTFHERNEAMLGTAIAADTITGGGTVQMQGDIELGTGGTTPSSWTGTITVAQNSSVRMVGGMTITGQVQIGQGSNGFFNKTAGGSNVATAGVSCLGSTSHIVGPAAVTKTGGSSAVTIVTTGAGCYNF